MLVFDGRHLPAKKLTETRRGASRKEAKEKAKELLREGKTLEARTYINRAVNITHQMAHQLIEECRKRNVDCIVAPYEADGQLAYLSRQQLIDYVITEDSDLTLFGCRKIIFKFDLTGQGLLFEADHLYQAMGCREDRFKFAKFEMMAILSGCDYLDSLRGVGLAKACKFALMTEETDMRRCLKKIPQYLNLKGVTVDDEYVEGFLRAMFTFRHMIVYDPRSRQQVHLTEPNDEDLPYCDNAGEKMLDGEIAFQLAIGNVNPFTLKQIDSWDPAELNTDKYPSIWGNVGGGGGNQKKSGNLIITVNKTNSVSNGTAKRKILKPINMIEEEEKDHAMNTSVDIMNMYLDQPPNEESVISKERDLKVESPPEAKKIRLSNPPVSDRSSKNPFLKKAAGTPVVAQGNGQEEKEEDQKMHFSLLQQANAIKVETTTVSKFKKTRTTASHEDKKVNVVSRFFRPSSSSSVSPGREKGADSDQTVSAEEEGANDIPQDNTIKEMINEDASEDEVNPADNDSPLIDSEEMDCSAAAFVETQFSTTSTDSQMQRDNEQSPIPWLPSYSQEDNPVQDTLNNDGISSQLSDKENDAHQVIDDNNNNNQLNSSIVISDNDETPVKVKPQLVKKAIKKPAPIKTLVKPKQPTLMSFFTKKKT